MTEKKTFVAKLNKRRVGHRKVLLVRDLVAGKSVLEAQRILSFLPQKGASLLLKSLNSAAAAAKDSGFSANQLKVAEILVNKGAYTKTFQAVSRGRAHNILKPTTHIVVKLAVVGGTK